VRATPWQGELRSSLRRTSLYRKGGREVQRNNLSEQRYALESTSKCMQWMATTPIAMTSRTPIGRTSPPIELQQDSLKKSMCRMTASICVEKLGVHGVVSSTMRSTVVTSISDVPDKEAAVSLQPMFFTPPSTDTQPQMNGRATELDNRDKPMFSEFGEPPNLWNPFKEPFSQWECSCLQKLQGQHLCLYHPRPQQNKCLKCTITELEVDANL